MPRTVWIFSLSLMLYGCSSQEPVATNSEFPAVITTPAEYPDPTTWEAASETQAARAARSLEQLRQRNVPVYDGPLFVADDHEVKLQDASEVARRALILWAVELRAEGLAKEEARRIIDNLSLWDSVSPEEKRFLEEDNPDPDEARRLVWRLESLWVMMWALGYIDELTWPENMCDVEALVDIIEPNETNPDFIAGAKLRSKEEILDAQDLTMRIHWAIRDTYLSGETSIPANLDWSEGSPRIPIEESAAVGVVAERHYALNWLVNFLDPESWDAVDTPT